MPFPPTQLPLDDWTNLGKHSGGSGFEAQSGDYWWGTGPEAPKPELSKLAGEPGSADIMTEERRPRSLMKGAIKRTRMTKQKATQPLQSFK